MSWPVINPTIAKFQNQKKQNGAISSDLVFVSFTNPRFTIGNTDPRLTPAASQAFTNLMSAFFAANPLTSLTLTGCYRDNLRQQEVYQKLEKGTAAIPGTSFHGWGIAIDLFGFGTNNRALSVDRNACITSFRGFVYQWFHENAHKYGWYNGNPSGILRKGYGNDEFWHWEYWGNADTPSSVPAPKPLPELYNPANNDPTTLTSVFPQTPQTAGTSNPDGSNNPDLSKLFEEIEINLSNSEIENSEAGWGKRENELEDSDWIGFRQYLLHMASKFSPGSLFPFIELIPFYYMNGEIPADNAKSGELTESDYEAAGLTSNEFAKQVLRQGAQEKANKYAGEYPPGYDDDRFKKSSETFNDVSGATDLFNIDPFRQEIDGMYLESESGKSLRQRRGVGARIYSQFVLNPVADLNNPSKPGAIGFEDLEINAGDPTNQGMTLITMTLVDIQGNKFTDVNSPWAFIFEARPGTYGGEFLFRFGWQIRFPKDEKDNIHSQQFWNHPGWELFPSMKEEIKNRLATSNELLTLTQYSTLDNMFEQDAVYYDELSNRIVATTLNVEGSAQSNINANYLRLSSIAPALEVDPQTGVMKAKLSFYSTSNLNTMVPLGQSVYLKSLFVKSKECNLSDLIEAYDQDVISFQSPTRNVNTKNQTNKSNKYTRKGSNSNFIKVVGMSGELGTGSNISPNAVKIKISKKDMKELTTASNESTTTLISWLSSVLEDNNCSLLSMEANGGMDLNATYTIVCAQAEIVDNALKQEPPAFDSKYDTVLGYRFQGSLIESISVVRNENPNAQSIDANYKVAGWSSTEVALEGEETLTTFKARGQYMLYAFAQLQNLNATLLCHPWLGVGNTVFIKGMGYLDGRYQVLQVTHTLDSTHRFITNIVAARMWVANDKSAKKKEVKQVAMESGKQNYSKPAAKEKDYYVENVNLDTYNIPQNIG